MADDPSAIQNPPPTIQLDAPPTTGAMPTQAATSAPPQTIQLDAPVSAGTTATPSMPTPTPQRQFVTPVGNKVQQVRYQAPGYGVQEFTSGSTEEQQFLAQHPQAKPIPGSYMRKLQAGQPDYLGRPTAGEKIESETPQARTAIEGQEASDAWKDFKSRMLEPVKTSEIESLPGLAPRDVDLLRNQGLDTLGSIFGKQRADYIREHILNGSYVVNQPPEEFARAALKTLTDWYSPAMLMLSAPGRLAHGYAAGADAALKVGDVMRAADLAGKARLVGILGTATGVPFVAKQVHSLAENWDGMSPAERIAAISGILGGAMMTGVSAHETGITPSGIKSTAGDLINKVSDAIPSRGVKSPAESMQAAQDALYQAIKPGKKAVNDDFKSTLEAAMPQLSIVANQNPDVANFQDMANAIQQHSDAIDGQLKQKALELRGQPQAIMHGIEDDVLQALEKGFQAQGKKYTADEAEAATKAVLKQLGITYTVEKDPDTGAIVPNINRVERTPDLFDAEKIRQRFKDDTDAAYGAGRGSVPGAEVYAKQVANQAIRDAIDQKFTELGVKGVKDWRRQQADLITVKDAMMSAMNRTLDEKGNPKEWSALAEMAKMKGWGVLPLAFGYVHPVAGAVALGGVLAKSYLKNQAENPNVLTRGAHEALTAAGPSAKAALPDFSGANIEPEAGGVGPTPEKSLGEGTSAVGLVAGEAPRSNNSQDIQNHISEIERFRRILRDPRALPEEKDYASKAIVTSREALQELEGSPGDEENPMMGAAGSNGPTPQKLLDRLPTTKRYPGTVLDDIHHELGHAIVGAENGIGIADGIRSDRHPENVASKAVASMPMDYPNSWFNRNGDFKEHSALDQILTMFMGGGAAEEALSGIPMDTNRGIQGDLKTSQQILEGLGYSKAEATQKIEAAKTKAREILTRPEISDIVKKYSGEREEGLHPIHHMSKDRVEQILGEIKDARNQKETANAGGIGTIGAGVGETNVAGREGGSSSRVGQEAAKLNAPQKKEEVNRGSALLAGAAAAAGPVIGGLAALAGRKKEVAPPSTLPITQTPPREPRAIPDIIDEAAEKSGVPIAILRAQARQESGLNPRAVSKKGAKGVMQLMDPVAQQFGVDDPYDPEQNIPAGAQYLADLHRRLGHWDRALGAYNWGADHVKNAVAAHGEDWLDYAPAETQNYVKSILGGKK